MPDLNRHLPHITNDRFSIVPKADIPRSTFLSVHSHKTTFDTGYLVPIHVDEVLPGDSHHGSVSIFARLSTLLFPIMDSVYLETFFFFVPNRLIWSHWPHMHGQRDNPADSISYTTPQTTSPTGGFAVGSVFDYFGLPTVGQVGGGNTVSVNALPLRAYHLIYNEWFRDQNLQNNQIVPNGDGPDTYTTFLLFRRNKQHDYFTSCLPWPLKGGVDVTLPLAGSANIKGIAIANSGTPTAGTPSAQETGGNAASGWAGFYATSGAAPSIRAAGTGTGAAPVITADLSTATGATINALRVAFQTQRLLERDARGGTRYTEHIRNHFGVISPDARLQRPEYIGGGKSTVQTSAVPQTSATGLTGGSSPLGALGATAVTSDHHTFSYHATEHGFIIGIAHVGADLTYQQGTRRMWWRLSRYDYYYPVFAFLGEQAVYNREIFTDGSVNDAGVFGYQERWSEYRHFPSLLTGLFRSTSTGTIDPWHLAQKFTGVPALNSTFIQDTPPMSRVLAAGAAANGMQILFDSVFRLKRTRAMPMFSVPGNIDRF